MIITPILLSHQIGHDLTLIILLTHDQILGHGGVGLNGPNPVNARHRGDDDHVITLEQGAGGRMAHPVDLFVDLALFFDKGVRARHIGLGLIIVVIADEIFNGIVREKPLKLAIELRR